ncbi:MAG: MoxR family ATPase [Pseudomonas sp.]
MEHREALLALRQFLATQILGQEKLIERLLIALLADGHLLVEGAPGLAKTKAIKELAEGIEAEFHRIQFTPDLLPADITGTEIYRPETGSFVFQQGPIFHNLVLADEINRAPAKVQSALLEAMAERQVSIGRSTYNLSPLFLVMATQNPIEQEGTYPLPEAQLDRFLMHVEVGYPDEKSEAAIMRLNRDEENAAHGGAKHDPAERLNPRAVFDARKEIGSVTVSDPVEKYIVALVFATRYPDRYDRDLAKLLQVGVSPRGVIGLDKVSRAYAWLKGRDYVTPDDVKAIVNDVFRHRLILSYDAHASNTSADKVIDRITELVAVS